MKKVPCPFSKDELQDMYHNKLMTISQIGLAYGASFTAARNRMVSYKIKFRCPVKRPDGTFPMSGKKHSQETRTRMSLFWMGKRMGKENGFYGDHRFSKENHPMWGRKQTEEMKRKLSEDRRGDKSPMWKGGITPLNVAVRALREYREWRMSVFKRDGFSCVLCGSKKHIEADHYPNRISELIPKHCIARAVEATLFPDFWDIGNGRTLCRECHRSNGHWHKKTT